MRSPNIVLLLTAAGMLLTMNTKAKRLLFDTGKDTTGVETARHNYLNTANPSSALFNSASVLEIINAADKATIHLGTTARGNSVKAWFFKGKSNLNAMIIAGVHGSELSAIEVANRVREMLENGDQPYYNVIIVPTVFPDNAQTATRYPEQMGSVLNIGRYTFPGSVDPNRQMPTPGKAFQEDAPFDHIGRVIEWENQVLLKLISVFRPVRIASVHAIRNTSYGGIYADPRTDETGIAMGYTSDSILAIEMARTASRAGSNVAGNRLEKRPNALYYKDPRPVPQGRYQPRNMTGSPSKAHKGSGVSMGTWGTTAIAREEDHLLNRAAMRIITIEFPGAMRPADYKSSALRMRCDSQANGIAKSLKDVFLEAFEIEEFDNN